MKVLVAPLFLLLMNGIITPSETMQPRIVTLAELRSKLLPLCLGNKWAEGAIVDLWKKGAPVPQPAGEPERRILIPGQFKKWWDDLNQRLGIEATAENFYQPLSMQFAASAGQRRRSKQFTRRRG